MTPEQALAKVIVQRHELSSPVDIEALAHEYATLQFIEWPFDCDGITVGLAGIERPTIFVKESTHRLRRRFTVAHELGHVLLPWHVDSIACVSADKQGELAGGNLREKEAHSFASHVLITDDFLKSICADDIPIAESVRLLDRAEVSLPAGLIGLTRGLPTGTALIVQDTLKVYVSKHTVTPPVLNQRTRAADWAKAAAEWGSFEHHGRTIHWFRFEQLSSLIDEDDPRESRQLLRDAVAALTDDESEQQRIQQRVNGVVGFVLGSAKSLSATRALATMKHRIRAQPDLAKLLNDIDFEIYLTRRARAFADH